MLTTDRMITLPWSVARQELGWKQGEHITIIGPTGQGKTTLALDLMGQRRYPLIVATKPRDPVMSKLAKSDGYQVIHEWPPVRERTILWPPLRRPEDKYRQAVAVHDALTRCFVAGGYAILIDELSYVIDELKCRDAVTAIWQQGRTLNLSLVTCVLRPSGVPLLAYDQATYVIMFRDADETNLRRMGGLGYWSRREIIENVSQLQRHEFLVLNTRDGRMIRSKTERI